MFRHLLVSFLLLSYTSNCAAFGGDKIDGKFLIGKWQPEKLPAGIDKLIFEFTKDNKLIIEFETQGQKQKFEGSYKLEGDKLSFKIVIAGSELDEKRKVLKLTENEFVARDEEKNEEHTLKKIK